MCMSVEESLLTRRLSSSRHLSPALESLAFFVKAGHYPRRLMQQLDEALVSISSSGKVLGFETWEDKNLIVLLES